jgi:hypothetical protein
LILICGTAPAFAHPGHDDDAAFDPNEHVPRLILAADAAPLVKIEVRDGFRYIDSDGMPNHPTGQFPNRGNPNGISAQQYHFRVPVKPTLSERIIENRPQPFGVAVNGLVFDPTTAEFWQDDPSLGWRMEGIGGPRNLGLDQNNAHVQPGGAYHYHGVPVGLIQKLAKPNAKPGPVLLGWAADGFPMYSQIGYSNPKDAATPTKKLASSYRLRSGNRPAGSPPGRYDGSYTRDWEFVEGKGDLDECNGRFGVTPEYPEGTYYYVVTDTFPFIPRFYHAVPDTSFDRQDGGRGGPRRGGRGPGGEGRGPRGRGGPPPPQQ